ncbi:MAG TPA: phosphoribosylformylglycinamidine synthase subunit PurQ, partial [Candidatus Polarisedimenticolia bacterium]|nr:phosphoribosylformylglycinamidine synthase subunit PurQ [Candidatus Polarisedimenticolia bacterium]
MKFGIVVFPGSNCDHDVYHVAKHLLGQEAAFLWHKDHSFVGIDCVVLPGGFAHGDYLRCGALARFSPIMKAIEAFAERGGLVFGICNGFQVLAEAGLLPGALVRNASLQYICRDVYLRVERQDTPFTARVKQGTVLKIPIGHGEGCYYAPEEALRGLEEKRQVVFRYCDGAGQVNAESNPNGSLRAIA